jgi:DNA primase
LFSYAGLRRRKKAVGEDVATLKRRLPLLDYLRRHNWTGKPAGRSEFVGLCPLHEETQPSFYVNARKQVFYCHGCGQGGDLIRFVELSRHLSFRESLAYLDLGTTPEADSATVFEQAAAFYQKQLDRYPEALGYLRKRGIYDPALIKELGIGYAPGGNLRQYLMKSGYSVALLRKVDLICAQNRDILYQRIVFPLRRGETSSTSMAAASALPFPIVSCPAARVGYMTGKRSGMIRKSSWSKDCSTMLCCGRRASKT